MVIGCNNCRYEDVSAECLTCRKAGGNNNNWKPKNIKPADLPEAEASAERISSVVRRTAILQEIWDERK